ncbi:MAG: sugar phosphate isomerase/epimerase [Treponemataceae bacterium]
MKLSLQLYSIREETAKDFVGCLEKVAEVGYTGVEFAGYGNLSGRQMKTALDLFGLSAVSSHVPMIRLKNNLDEEIDFNLEVGNKYIVCPWYQYATREDFVKTAKLLNKIGEKCKKKGLQLGYHNHAFEFVKFGDEFGFDILYKESDPDLVMAEIDVCWINRAGEDPAAYIRKFGARCPLVHLKDRRDTADVCFAEIGEGCVDIPAVIKAGLDVKAKHFIIEQDRSARAPFESMRINYENTKKIGLL